MDRKKIERFLLHTGKYLFVLVCGLILTFNPQGATAWVTGLLGWVLVALGAAGLILPALGKNPDWLYGRPLVNGLCIVVGVILLAKPMIIANLIGRTIGIILMCWGLSAFKDGDSRLTAVLTVLAGLVLVCIPASLTNTLLTLCGILVTIIAVVNIIAIWKAQKRLTGTDQPRIIDADM